MLKIIFARDCRRKEFGEMKFILNINNHVKVNNEVGEFFIYVYKNLMDKYIYLENDKCEADDVIGVLTKKLYKIIKYIL